MVSPVDSRAMETKDILASIEETKDLIRRVRTPGGARRYGQPIGSIIVPDAPIPGARRKRSKRTASAPTTQRSAEPKKGRQRGAQERTIVQEAQVAPTPEVAQGSGETVEVDVSPHAKTSVYNSNAKYVKNDPLILSEMDMDFMKNGTAREAYDRLKAMGATVEMGKAFVENRDLMTSLSEVVRILEQEFPGFVERHGNFFSQSKIGAGIAFNAFLRLKSTKDDLSQKTGDMVHDESLVSTVFGGMQGSIEAASNNATATVFTPNAISWDESKLRTYMSDRRSDGVAWMSMSDGADAMLDAGLTPAQVGALHVATHELGHAISMAVAGRLSFEIDGKEDPQQEQRRWYREYYANARLQFFEEMGIAKRTGKEYVADSLIKQKEYNEFFYRYAPKTKPPTGPRPRNAAWNATPEVKERARQRILKWNAAVKAYKEESQRLALEMMAELRRRADAGEDMILRPTADDVANGSSAEDKSLPQFLRGLADAGYLEPDSLNVTPLNSMTSRYGATKWVETEAETWAAYMLNNTVTEGVNRWGEQMHTMYQWWTDDDAEMGKTR